MTLVFKIDGIRLKLRDVNNKGNLEDENSIEVWNNIKKRKILN